MSEQWVRTGFSGSLSGRASRDTVPEMLLRSALHKAGLRFRVHRRIGRFTVDIVLPRHHIAVYVDGCFWHAHGCKHGGGKIPSGPNGDAWAAKFRNVKERERQAESLLAAEGYSLVRIWECSIKKDPAHAATQVTSIIKNKMATNVDQLR
jgi:DNA mismatch endonuclease (patch repair protein)